MPHRLFPAILIAFFIQICITLIAHGQWAIDTDFYNGSFNCMIRTGENLIIAGSGGIFRSANNGKNWRGQSSSDGLPPDFYIETLFQFDSIIFAGGDDYGIYRSLDSGATWSSANNGVGNPYAYAFASIDNEIFSGTDGGVLSSTDDGLSWISPPVGFESWTACSFAVKDTDLWAGTYNGEIYLTSDRGSHWLEMSDGFTEDKIQSMLIVDSMIIAGMDNTFAGGVYVSSNYGKNWTSSGLNGSSVHSLVLSNANIFAGTDQGVFFSTDKGETWTNVSQGLDSVVVTVLLLNDTTLMAGAYMLKDPASGGIWTRPISEMIGSKSDVQLSKLSNQYIEVYPNPFPGSTSIQFTTSMVGAASIQIINSIGQQMAQLFDGTLDAGQHSFSWDAENAPTGTYFCVLHTGNSVIQTPMMLSR